MESDEELLIIETVSPDNRPDDGDNLAGNQQAEDGGIGDITQGFPVILATQQPRPGTSAEVNRVEVQIELDTDAVEQPYLTLPDDKDRHLFVSHSSEDSNKVWPIVEALEKRFNVTCIYADRDFQPGMDIMTNVKEGMERSWKVLLMLSPSFTLSGWCKYERDYAFVKSIESRTNGIIPVLLEECELPPTLKTVTYINATQSFCDVPAKVIQAMIRPDIAETMMTFDSLKRYENGYCVDIVAQRDELWKYRPAKYKFSLEQHHITTLRDAQIKLPIALIEEALTLLNKCRAVRHYDFSVSRKKLLCWSVFLLPLLGLVIYGDVLLHQTINRGRAAGLNDPYLLMIYRDVHKKMWKEMFQRCLEMDTILLFSASRDKKPTVIAMGKRKAVVTAYMFIHSYNCFVLTHRYNENSWLFLCVWSLENITVSPASQDFLTHLTLSKSITDKESRAKKYSWGLIVDHLWSLTPVMMLDYEKLPDASYNRHNVRLGKACICQCLEQSVGTNCEQIAF